MSDLLADLRFRGLIHQTTDEAKLAAWLAGGSRVLYAGFDPTADSMHVGHLVAMLMLRRFQKFGHKPIALVGGATGMIGDPSGKSAERNLLSIEALQANVRGMSKVMERFLDFGGANGATIVNNYDWMSKFSYLDFLRDIGKHFPLNVMLSKDSVASRLTSDAGISYTEFSYMLLQAYDFVHLHRAHGCGLQIGGSDQWGNITAGTDLARRMNPGNPPELFALTFPLLLNSEGNKMGKTEKGAVWLTADRTSPFAFYQYWMRVPDVDAGKCLRTLTELPHEEILALDASRAADAGKRDSQRRLAESLTLLVHGAEGLAKAQTASDVLYKGQEFTAFNERELEEIVADVPSVELPRAELEAGIKLIDAFCKAKLCTTNSDARRLIEQGGAYVNNRVRKEINELLKPADLVTSNMLVLRSGKKMYSLLRFTA